MDGRMNFTLDRGRFLPTTHASATLGTLSHSYDGSSGTGALRHPLADLGRTGTPSTLASLGQFGGRYFPSSSLPFHTGAGYVMDNYLGSRSQTGADGIKPSLHQYPQYWAAQSEGLARQYGLAGSVYSPYLPLLHGADPMAAVYPHAAAAAALAQAQAPYHRIYDLRTDPNYGSLAMAGGQPTIYSSSLHSPATEPLLLQAPAPSLLTGEGKPEGQTSLEKLSLAVESAGGGGHPVSKKHSIKTEPGASKSQDGMKSVSGMRKSESKREKKSNSSDSKRDVKDNKDSSVPKEVSQGGHAKSKKESSGSHTSPSSKTGVVLPRAEKIEGKKTSENWTPCDKRVASPQKKSARELHTCTDLPKPKAVVLSSAVTEHKAEDDPQGSSQRPESSVTVTSSQSSVAVVSSQSSAQVINSQSNPSVTVSLSTVTATSTVRSLQPNVPVTRSQTNNPVTSSLSVVALTTVTFTTSESKSLMTTTSSGPSVFSVQPSTRMTTAIASNNAVSRTDASEYLGASSGPYHTVYSYTQQNKPVREGSKVHATTVTPEVGTLPSPVVPTCTTTVIQAKSSGDEVRCKVEGSRSSCCAMTTTTSSRGQPKCGEGHTQSAKKKSPEGKQKSAIEKGSKATNSHEKLTEQLNNTLTPKYEGSGYVASSHQVMFPQPQGVGIDCGPRDIYGNPLPFPSKTLPFSGAPITPYDTSLRPMDLSSPKEKKRKERVKSPSESSRNSSDSESGKNSKKHDSTSTVPYRDIIHEYGQPRNRVTLLETHLPADKTPSSSPGMAGAGSKQSVTPSSSPRLWYDYNMTGQQMVMGSMPGRYMYPYGQIQPYYPIPPEGSVSTTKAGTSSVQSASPVSGTPAGQGPGSAESGKESDNKSGSGDKGMPDKTKSEGLPGKDRVSPVCKDTVTPGAAGKSDSDSNSATPTRQMSPACNKSQLVVPNGNNSEEHTNSRYVAPLRSCPTVGKATKHLPLGSVKPSGPGLKTCKDHTSGEENVAISGSGIPVGIAVARQRQDISKDVAKDEVISDVNVTSETCTYSQERSEREEFLREQKELLDNRSLISTTATSNSGDVRTELSANLVVTGGNVLSTATGWRDGGDATRQYPANQWIQTGPTINPALWVGQAAFGMPPTLPATPALDTSHLPFTASGGFKLAQDPVTGQLFLIPTANLSNLAYASTPFQHGTSTAQTVMAAQPFTQMTMSSQPITAPPPPVDPSSADQPDKDAPNSPQEGTSSEDPQDGCSDEGQSTQSNSPHRPASDSAGEQQGAEEESAAVPGETTMTSSEGEKADCPTVPIAPQTAYIAGYPSMGAGQTYATYSYPHPQISYLYDPSLLSTYSMPMPAALPEAAPVAAPIAAPIATSVAAPVVAVKPECPAVRSQGTSPIVVSTANTPTIPTATVAAFSEASPPAESQVKGEPKAEVKPEEEAEKIPATSSTPPCLPEEPPAPKLEGPTVIPSPTSPTESSEKVVDMPVISESIGAAKVLQKLKHSKVKKEKKKKDPTKSAEKKAEKKSEKKHSCDKKTNSDKQSHSEKKKDKSGKVKKSKLKAKNSDQKKAQESGVEERVNYNPYTDPQILQAADGLELLSALAEKWSKCSPVEDEEKPEVSKPDNVIDEYEFTDNPVIDINRNYSPNKTGKRTCYADSEKLSSTPSKKDVTDLPPMFASTGLAWPTDLLSFLDVGPDTMDAMELEIRLRLAELQRRYKQKQRELSKLHPKKDKEEEDKSLTKRGPGRPRKRKFISRKSESQNTSASDSGKSSSYKEPVAKKKKLVEKLVDRVFRKTGRDKKSKKNKALGLVSSTQKHGPDVTFDNTDTGLIGNKSLSEETGLLQKTDGHSLEATKVKSKSKSKDGKKQKSHGSHDKSSKKGNLGLPGSGKEKKSKKILKKSCLSGDSADVNTGNISQGISDSSEGDCGVGMLTKFSGTSTESAPSGGKKKKRKVEEGVLGDKGVVSMNAGREDSKHGPPVTKRESDTDHSDPTSVTKRRKPGRPKKYCNPGKSAGNTETIVAKKPKHIGMMKYKNKERKIDMKAQEKKMKLENSSVLKPLYLEEKWSLRRSERIFLSEPSPQPSPNGPLGTTFGLNSPTQELKSPRGRSKSLDKPKAKVNRSKSLQDISHKVKMKYSKSYGKKVMTTTATTATGFAQQRMLTQVDAYGRRPGKYGQYYVDSDSNTGESSDGDDLPLSTLRDRAITPEPRSCVLDKDDLVDGLRVLLLMDGLFHEGAVKAIRPPDVYGVLIDGERGNRPHIYSQEEILKEAILDVQPGSPRFVPEGTRVCAYWSQQFSCLYPGTVCRASPDPHADPNFVSLEFDDGDSGTIPFDHIRMLPPGYPHVSYDTNPILIVGKRRRRTISEDLEYCRSSTSELSPVPGSTAIKWAKYRTSVSKVKTSWEKGAAKGGNLLELEEEVELKDSVFEAESHQTFGRVVSQDKKQHGKKKHKHRNKDELSAASDGKHKHKKHKKTGKEDKMRPASAMFSGPNTSFASLAQSEACQTLVSSTKTLGSSGFLLQSTSYEEKTYNWVMRNPLATDRIGRTMEDCESADNTAESICTTNPDGDASEKSDDDTDVGDQSSVKAQPKGKGRPKSTGEKKKKAERSLSTESKTFLPTRQLWKWSGKSTKRPGMKGKARKEFYKAIQRGREHIRVGDCAVFLSTGRPNLPFVGRIENFWEAWGGNMVVRVKWFYHPEETKGGKKLPEPKGALFQSPHGDENDVQTISHRCDVLPYMEYNQYKMEAIRRGNENLLDSEEIYYLAGNYDPSSNHISYEQHVMG
ncbi:uncharacterized protein LOC135469813 isoform X2 [Liolophura sinensis]|uniref:uncharacterized protein LOC135469813 isoform X2 n=1 Tax=Liolophura sinensis TaxID=3198878 RepID=UPI0031585399